MPLEGISMQVVILAGGFGTRLSEETDVIPKPMVQIGNVPILRHIMNYYAKFDHTDFIVALGYKANVIIEYFDQVALDEPMLSWNIQLIDTGLETATGGRIKRLENFLEDEFLLTYGDGLSDVDLNALLDFHRRSNRIATLTAVKPPPRFGTIEVSNGLVTNFAEKDPKNSGWINGGFFYFNKKICSLIDGDQISLENEPLSKLVVQGELGAFEHYGWWQPMDTLRDKRTLESIWENSSAPWLMN
jgi:glucose-1-phosphate cytidylyltransferase